MLCVAMSRTWGDFSKSGVFGPRLSKECSERRCWGGDDSPVFGISFCVRLLNWTSGGLYSDQSRPPRCSLLWRCIREVLKFSQQVNKKVKLWQFALVIRLQVQT